MFTCARRKKSCHRELNILILILILILTKEDSTYYYYNLDKSILYIEFLLCSLWFLNVCLKHKIKRYKIILLSTFNITFKSSTHNNKNLRDENVLRKM